ncbi:MAG TPA: hypothetical protein VH988_09390 [Thermoanaerobaculia bacterium]|jgi:hypothetical protein|nr:hypothetical protein [Thermoanaerobaculia bacterium]
MPRRRLWCLLLALSCSGCATSARAPWAEYCKAVAATRIPAAKNLSHDLVPIVRSTPRLRWNDQGQVLMATLAASDCKDHGPFCRDQAGKPVILTGEVWLSAAPFLQNFCRGLPRSGTTDLKLRLLQRLGIAPEGVPVDVVVQLWIDPRDFFRPCVDPEVTDGECTLSLTPDAGDGSGCPWKGSAWMCHNWENSYPSACGPGVDPIPFPWTGLGYTWDWSPDNPTHHGESEFVAPQGKTVTIESVTGIAEYCR